MNLKATRINLFDLKTTPMRTFHLTWLAFFCSFFGWFGIAPLMSLVRDDLNLTKAQIGNTIIASVAITTLVRLVIGWLCDRIGPRRAYTILLIAGSLPIMGIGLAQNYETFLLFRLAIGAIGASFVITQYHTSVMFAPNCVGTANATAAGWGNMGGGAAQMAMPLILAAILSLGVSEHLGWRIAMIVPGAALFIMGILYFYFTQDFPEGNLDLKKTDKLRLKNSSNNYWPIVLKDRRVCALFIIYAASFGVELTINNIAALYFTDMFSLSMTTAGFIAGLFGFMNLFARTLGGYFSDKYAKTGGLKARVKFLGSVLFVGGIALTVFAKMTTLTLAVPTMLFFALFIKMANGATYSIVPFINKKALGLIAGLVGAGGNVGGVLFGFLFRAESLSYSTALFYLGLLVVAASFFSILIRFSLADEKAVKTEFETAQAQRLQLQTT